MTPFGKIAAPVTCVAVICGGTILWPVSRWKAAERKFTETKHAAQQGDADGCAT